MIDFIIGKYNYIIVIVLMLMGLYTTIINGNLFKKVVGLNVLSTSIILFYISISKVKDGSAPIYAENVIRYDNPLPHVLMLTAIVVGVSVTAVALSIIIKIKENYGTVEEDEIVAIEQRSEGDIGNEN
jgi:multicomponent Na+:H+ antiporter subunit C